MKSTVFALMYEFGTAHIDVAKVGIKYFGYKSEPAAKKAAASNKYPFPVCRAGNNKSGWFVDVEVLAEYLDKKMEKAAEEFRVAR